MNAKNSTFSSEMINGIPWVIISKLLLFFIYFAVSVITVRFLGSNEYGIYVLCKSIAEVLILICTLGMTASYIRYIPELVINKNRAGMNRLIVKSGFIQLTAVVLFSWIILNNTSLIESLFSTNFNGLLLLTCGLVLFELVKTNINALLTALYKVKLLSILSLFHGLLWLTLLVSLFFINGSVENALLAPTVSYGIIYLIAAIGIFRYLSRLDWRSPSRGIGKRRVFMHSGSVALATILRLIMLKYSELFFLGTQHDPEVVGAYDLAYSIPLMVIVFIPSAIQDLFSTGFSEAYVKDKNILPRLISAYYKMLILLSVPLAIFGFFFAPHFFELAYGNEMALAGELAAWFCLFHVFALVSVPLSMAIQAKEKTASMLPTLTLQIAVNIALGYLFIVHLQQGVWGAFTAITLTLLLTLPIRLYRVKQLIGGLYIPVGFFLKTALVCFVIGWSLATFADALSPILLFMLAPVYYFIVFYLLFSRKILNSNDIEDLTQLTRGRFDPFIKRLNPLLSKITKFKLIKLSQRRLYNE